MVIEENAVTLSVDLVQAWDSQSALVPLQHPPDQGYMPEKVSGWLNHLAS
jgi:hypothetical protein